MCVHKLQVLRRFVNVICLRLKEAVLFMSYENWISIQFIYQNDKGCYLMPCFSINKHDFVGPVHKWRHMVSDSSFTIFFICVEKRRQEGG